MVDHKVQSVMKELFSCRWMCLFSISQCHCHFFTRLLLKRHTIAAFRYQVHFLRIVHCLLFQACCQAMFIWMLSFKKLNMCTITSTVQPFPNIRYCCVSLHFHWYHSGMVCRRAHSVGVRRRMRPRLVPNAGSHRAAGRPARTAAGVRPPSSPWSAAQWSADARRGSCGAGASACFPRSC